MKKWEKSCPNFFFPSYLRENIHHKEEQEKKKKKKYMAEKNYFPSLSFEENATKN